MVGMASTYGRMRFLNQTGFLKAPLMMILLRNTYASPPFLISPALFVSNLSRWASLRLSTTALAVVLARNSLVCFSTACRFLTNTLLLFYVSGCLKKRWYYTICEEKNLSLLDFGCDFGIVLVDDTFVFGFNERLPAIVVLVCHFCWVWSMAKLRSTWDYEWIEL